MRRRSIVSVGIVLAVVAALAGGLGSVVGSAGAASPKAHRALIVCPLRSSPAIVTCCGPIVARADVSGTTGTSGATGPTGVTGPIPCCYCCCCGAQPAFCCGVGPTPQVATPLFCCPPNALCARPLPTISSSPNPSTEGAPITVSGAVSTTGATGGTGVSGVTLWQELPYQHAYGQLASTSAKADGSYSFAIPAGAATTNRNWYVTNGTARSFIDQQLVEAKITASESQSGGEVTVTGTVAPSHAGGRVLIQQESGTQWNVIGRARIGRGSRYVAHLRLHGTGSVTLRVELPAGRLNTESFSQNLTVVLG